MTFFKTCVIIQSLKGSKDAAARDGQNLPATARLCYDIVRTKNKFSGIVKLNNGFLRLLRNVCRKSLFLAVESRVGLPQEVI